MSLEERLNNLAQTVELLAGMQIKTEEKMQLLIESNRRLDGAMLQVAKILPAS